jgi:hypothetical protein
MDKRWEMTVVAMMVVYDVTDLQVTMDMMKTLMLNEKLHQMEYRYQRLLSY